MFTELVSIIIAAGFATSQIAPTALYGYVGGPVSQTKADVFFSKSERSVANWREESSRHLDLDFSIAKAFSEGGEPISVARCVKLNNYWCIKGAGWNGMIGADAEGHGAFASATEGASVAALLLRRYYMDFSRRSAQAIVSRWAPAQCGYAGAGALPTASILPTRRASAARGKTSKALRRPVRARLSAIDLALAPRRAVSLLQFEVRISPVFAAPLVSCADEAIRIQNYATKLIEGVATSIDEDLKLFEPNGAPTANLARVMTNMAAVEIGPQKINSALAYAGIDAVTATIPRAPETSLARPKSEESPSAAYKK